MRRMWRCCKEVLLLMVFREGFTQFRDTTSLGSGFGSPLGEAMRVEGQDEYVIFIRAELWRLREAIQKKV